MIDRGGSRAAATSRMEHFVVTVNGWKPLTIIRKSSILDVAAVIDLPLIDIFNASKFATQNKCVLQVHTRNTTRSGDKRPKAHVSQIWNYLAEKAKSVASPSEFGKFNKFSGDQQC